METSKIRPLYDRLLIQRLEGVEERTSSGLYIPDSAKEKAQVGKVVRAGKGRLAADGSVSPLVVKEGDVVFFGKYAGTDAGNDMLIIREDEVLGVVEE